MFANRVKKYQQLEDLRNSKLLIYITGDRQNAETNIGADILEPFSNHLDKIGDVDKISLFIYSNGGSTLAGWSLVNLIRSFCKDFEVIIPFRCQSAATLISLGSDRIVMTKQGTLGPIDPSTNGLMNPQVTINGITRYAPVSVEHVNGYMEMAKNDFLIKEGCELKDVYLKLSEYIHPLALGEVYKAKAQIQMLAKKLLKYHNIKEEDIPKVISFLCSESGSHDYTIYRKEAKEELGLNIEKPDEQLYKLINEIYEDISDELKLREPFNPGIILATNDNKPYNFSNRRALIESTRGGTDVFITEGELRSIPHNGGLAINTLIKFEGWKHEKYT